MLAEQLAAILQIDEALIDGEVVCHRRRIAEILTERHEFDVRHLSTQAL